MKKRVFGILLSLCMVLMLCPVTAFAEEPALTIDGADVVCAQSKYFFTVTPPEGVTLDERFGYDTGGKGSGVDLTIDENGVGHGVMSKEWYDLHTYYFDVSVYGYTAGGAFVSETKHVEVSQDHVYVDGVCGCGAVLQYEITYDGGEDVEGSIPAGVKAYGKDFTLSSETFTRKGYVQTGWQDREGNEYELGGAYTLDEDVTLYPVWDKLLTLTVPFTTTVKLGGDVAPGETTFDLEIVGNNAGDADVSDVTVTGSVTTNGAGDYDGTLTFTGPERQLWYLLSEGALVQQVDAGEEGWTYDDTVWGLLMTQDVIEYATRSMDMATGYRVIVVPAICDDAGNYYIDWESIEWDALQSEDMRFTNTYTKSITEQTDPTKPTEPSKPAEPTKPTESDPNSDTTTNPQTGDNSNLTLWFALLVVSAAGVIGTGVYSKRSRSSRAK